MLTDERHDVIRALLLSDGRVVANELAARFGVSEDTVRRDLRELAKAGYCRRVHGGALAPAPVAMPISARVEKDAGTKTRLAAEAVKLLQPRHTVFIDAGSTNYAIAQAIPRSIELTVVTNAPAIAAALADHELATVIMLGGIYKGALGSVGGNATVEAVEAIYADLVFLGSCAIDVTFGVSALDAVEAEVKRAMVMQSRAVAVAATSDKLGLAAPFRVARPASLTHLVVEAGADAALLDDFAAQGTTIHRVR
ncbi:MAG: DeoR family transcriptional regulator [Kaistia sp. SCN 65-12]|nr:DeoR/GlpR transcriptional regulator [Devosia sp.]ODT19140.1 MAG: DeoR family transcriptional regulator [Kaistia sp. SCN 65-12]